MACEEAELVGTRGSGQNAVDLATPTLQGLQTRERDLQTVKTGREEKGQAKDRRVLLISMIKWYLRWIF